MARKQKYRPGEIITVERLVTMSPHGTMVFWNGRPMSIGFLWGMPFWTVVRAAKKGVIKEAVGNE